MRPLPRTSIIDLAPIALLAAAETDDVYLEVYDSNEPSAAGRSKRISITDLKSTVLAGPWEVGTAPSDTGMINVDTADASTVGDGYTWKRAAVIGLAAISAGGAILLGSATANATHLLYNRTEVVRVSDVELRPIVGGMSLGTVGNPWADIRGTIATLTGILTTGGVALNGAVTVGAHGAYDIGTNAARPRDLWLSRDLTVGGTLTAAAVNFGAMVVTGLTVNGNAQVNGTLGATGTATLAGVNAGATTVTTLGASGTATLADVTATTLGLAGTLTWTPDNTHDIGAAGATRPRDLHLGRNALIGGTLGVTGTTTLGTVSAGAVTATSFAGAGGSLTGLNATQLTSGTIPDARFPVVIPVAAFDEHMSWNVDNAYDVGIVGGRPRDLNLGRNAVVGGTLGVTGTTTLGVLVGSSGTFSGAGSFGSLAVSGGATFGSISALSSLVMTGAITWAADNTFDVGATGATRPRDVHVGRNVVVGSGVTAATFTGNGALLTALNASELGSGTVPDARFPAVLPAISGANLTNLNASNLASGTVPNARLTGAYTGVTGLGTQAADLLFTDATYDIGKSGATRPRDGFFSRNVVVGNTLGVTGTTTLGVVGTGALTAASAIITTTLQVDGATTFNEHATAVGKELRATSATVTGALYASSVSGWSLVGSTSNHATALITNNIERWLVQATGHLVAAVDNTYDIGATGALRPRDLRLGRNALILGTLGVTGAATFGTLGAGAVTATSFSGDGSALTALNATQLTSGTVPSARVVGIYANVTGLGSLAADLLFVDATYDIGKTGATRPRDGFFSRNVTVGSLLTVNGGFTVASGQTVTLTGTSITGAPTWGSAQAITLTTAAQPNVTSFGTLAMDLLFTDATYDIGKSGATRPRDGFFSRNFVIGGTLGVSGLVTASAGATVASGQTLTLTGTSITGAPTWGSNQTITLATAAQPNVTSLGTLAASLLFVDATHDIGASGATRPRDLHVSRAIVVGTTPATIGQIRLPNDNVISWRDQGNTTQFTLRVNTSNLFAMDAGLTVSGPLTATNYTGTGFVVAGAAEYFAWTGRSVIKSPSDGVVTLYNNASSAFTRLQFGGTTSSFPALRRNGAVLDVVLADESAFTTLQTGAINANSTVTVSGINSSFTGSSATILTVNRTGTDGTLAAFQQGGVNALLVGYNGTIIDQGANDGEILTLRSSDVTHSFTGITNTNTFGLLMKSSATDGGLVVYGLADGSSGVALVLRASITTGASVTKSTSGGGVIYLDSTVWNGGASRTGVGANGNLLSVSNDDVVRFILDADGDSHQDVGTAWTNFDTHDDVALLNLMAAHVTRWDDPLRSQFGFWLQQNRNELERAKLVTFNSDGHHFVNMSRLTMLHTGAIRQMGSRIDAICEELVKMGVERDRLLPVVYAQQLEGPELSDEEL